MGFFWCTGEFLFSFSPKRICICSYQVCGYMLFSGHAKLNPFLLRLQFPMRISTWGPSTKATLPTVSCEWRKRVFILIHSYPESLTLQSHSFMYSCVCVHACVCVWERWWWSGRGGLSDSLLHASPRLHFHPLCSGAWPSKPQINFTTFFFPGRYIPLIKKHPGCVLASPDRANQV